MNDNYDFNSRKYIWLLIIVCFLFFIIVIKAFQYLPDRTNVPAPVTEQSSVKPSDTVQQTTEDTVSEENNTSEELTDEQKMAKKLASEKYKKDHKSGKIVFSNSEPSEFEEVQVPAGVLDEELPAMQEKTENVALTNEELALRAIINAKKSFREKNYSEALKEYQTVSSLTEDKELTAMSYEGISEIYVLSKRYGTALSFAAKAYNMSPSIAREMLIAKIYYRAGNTENAITRVNNLLKRDFSR